GSSISCADGNRTNTAGARKTVGTAAGRSAARSSMPMHPDLDALLPAITPPRLREVVLDCARGDLPPNVGLMQIFMAAADAVEAERTLTAVLGSVERGGAQGAAARLRAMIELWRRTPQAYGMVTAVLQIEHRGWE